MGQSPNSDDCNSDGEGMPFLQGNADFGLINPLPQNWCKNPTKIAPHNSVLLSVRAPIGAVNIANVDYCVGRGLCALISDNTKFTYYASVCLYDELNSLGTGSTFKAISTEQILNTFIALPPKSEQTAIAAFLDRKTAEIDQLIADKKQLLELYREEKTAIINKAVTKGINPDAKMKESGIEWLGEIPEHWEVKRLKYVAYFQRGHDLPSTSFVEGSVPVYGSNGIIGYHNENTGFGPSIIVGRSGSVGEVNFVPESMFWAHNTSLFLLKGFGNDINYLYYLLKILDLKSYAAGTAVGTLNRNNIHEIKVAIPELEEQKSIVEFIETKSKTIDAKIARTEKLIELLTEYRTTLISEVVTGKVKVVDN